MSDILFIKTSSLGDVIHHMPAVTEARRRGRMRASPGWSRRRSRRWCGCIRRSIEVIPVASRRWRARSRCSPSTWREIAALPARAAAQTYDAVIDTQGLVRSAIIARLARGRRHGYDRASMRERPARWLLRRPHYRVARSCTRSRATAC